MVQMASHQYSKCIKYEAERKSKFRRTRKNNDKKKNLHESVEEKKIDVRMKRQYTSVKHKGKKKYTIPKVWKVLID